MSNRSSTERASGSPAPKISVLTVVRNCEATLGRAIESVVCQLGDDAEFVIVDGASTDGTIDIIKAYDDRLAHWVSEPDRGIYDAMNKALALARGEWVIFLGADDELKPCLPAVARELVDPQTVYYGDVEIAASGAISGRKFNRYRLMQENICHQAIFYPRAVYRSKRYDTNIGMLADHQYNIELWGSGTRFVHIDQVVSRFNDAGASSSDSSYFEPVKMAAIRSSFGPLYYAVKMTRTMLVRLIKGRRESP
jgi:glycosyltransferase involved in cell wall biosynthesis